MAQLLKKCLYAGFLILIVTSCGIAPEVLADSESVTDTIVIGAGGGFTGRETVYLLTKMGWLYHKKGNQFQKVGKMDSNFVQQAFAIYEKQQFSQLKINTPGNTYYFIERYTAGQSSKLIWGNEPGQPELLYRYHRFLWNQIAILQDQKNQ